MAVNASCTKQRGISYLGHYLNDFNTAGAPKCKECNKNLSILIGTYDIFCLPTAIDRQVGPTMCFIFLGIELDTKRLNYGSHII